MMKTIVLKVNPQHPDPASIARAAAIIRRGGLVAFPTETVYGLGADALNAQAVLGIFHAKERPAHDPLIVHIADPEQLREIAVQIPDVAWTLAQEFWPGPLTLVLYKAPQVPSEVTAGGNTVAVRLPAHPVARALIRQAGTPIAAPSANRFGHVSPTRAEHVLRDLGGRIDLILDGGSTPVGVESTVLSLISSPPVILRPGGVSREALAHCLGPVVLRSEITARNQPALSPGMTLKHYAPSATLRLYAGERATALRAMHRVAEQYLRAGHQVGLLLVDEDVPAFRDLPAVVQNLGSVTDMATVAHRLFAGLRALDEAGVTVILTRDLGTEGLALAIRDRLTRAAAGQVILVDEKTQGDSRR